MTGRGAPQRYRARRALHAVRARGPQRLLDEADRVGGNALPAAIFGMLVIYCLKNVSILSGSHGIPEAAAILVVVGLHLWKRQMLLSIAGGTVCYMLLMQFVF